MRKTKILCTMGPACDSIPVLKELIREGMNIARLNMAHGDLDEHRRRIQSVRQASAELHTFIPILMDIKGPEIRVGQLKDPTVLLQQGQTVILTAQAILGDSERLPVSFARLYQEVRPGSKILIDDGLIELRVERIVGEDVVCTIVTGGVLKPRKGVNLPGVKTSLPGVTERDIQHIRFGVSAGIDIIAVSFVRRSEDIVEIRNQLEEFGAEHVPIISKIENEEGVENLDRILDVSDGLMVARGDLGVEIPAEDVPIIQKEMIRKSNLAGKPVIIATHMLESMQVNPRPTRAEVSDVANAVLDGADIVMLSGETAAGKYPVQSVAMMSTIATRAESTIAYAERFRALSSQHNWNVTEAVCQAAVSSSLELDAKAIITPTESGFTARMMAKYRPKAPIIAITPNEKTIPRLCLLRGVIPIKGTDVSSTDEMFASSIRSASQTGLLEPGDLVVISAGVPVGKTGATNLLKIEQVQ